MKHDFLSRVKQIIKKSKKPKKSNLNKFNASLRPSPIFKIQTYGVSVEIHRTYRKQSIS